MTVDYTPAVTGGWLALCAGDRVLLLQTADVPLTTALWAALRETPGPQTVLDLLARGGLAAMPHFALLDVRDAPRVIVRGGVTVVAHSSAGATELSGAGVTTWTEQVLPSATSFAVAVDGAAAVRSIGPLPMVDGVAWVAQLTVAMSASAGVTPPVSAGVVAAPVAEPEYTPSAGLVAVPEPGLVAAPDAELVAAPEPDPEVTVVELPDPSDVPAADLAEPAQSSGYDYLFGDTMYRDVAEAAVAEPATEEGAEEGAGSGAEESEPNEAEVPEPQTSAVPSVSSTAAGDHDGQTVLTSDIAKLRAERKAKRASRTTAPAAPVAPPAPTVVLTLPNGARESLVQPVLVGRAPSVSQVSGGNIPRLVTVGTADQDISRTHARFVLEGGTVVVTDLHSRNGTMIVLPGKEPQKLRAGEPTAVIVGTVIDFGGGVTLTVEET